MIRTGKLKLKAVGVIGVFIAILIIGLWVFDDYGIAVDDPFERATTLVNLKYIHQKLFPAAEIPPTLADQPDLADWEDRTYGVVTQLPTAAVEWLFGFSLSQRNIYLIRHLWTFIQFYAGLAAFYFLLRARFKSDWLALAGVSFLYFSPRIFADSFYNIKDIVFLSWMVTAGFFFVRWLESKRLVNLILFSIAASVATNVRVFGGILILYALFAVVRFVRRGEIDVRVGLRISVLMILLYGACWMIWMPYAWENPVRAVQETLGMVSANHATSAELYFGKPVSNQNLPWHYLPVWIAMTTPTIVLLGAMSGLVLTIIHMVTGRTKTLMHRLMDGLALTVLVLPLAMTMILRPPIYNGWRHLYYIYPWIVYFAVRCFSALFSLPRRAIRVICILLLFANIVWNGGWIIHNHPFQMVYFSEWFPREKRELFEKDYWCISCRDTLSWLMAADSRPRIPIATDGEHFRQTIYAFHEAELDRILIVENKPDLSDIEYLIIGYSKNTSTMAAERVFPSFVKVYELIVDGLPLHGVYQRNSKSLAGLASVAVLDSAGDSVELPALSDGERLTDWFGMGDIEVRLTEKKAIQGLTLRTIDRMSGIPEGLRILVSSDGSIFTPVKLRAANYAEFFFEPVEAVTIRIESGDPAAQWHISEIQVWQAEE